MNRTYESPKVRVLGDIRQITQGQLDVAFSEGFFQKKPDPSS